MMGSLRAIALSLILAPAIVAAQPSAKDKQQASDLVKKAIAKSQAGDHQAAVELYEQAYKIIPQPLLLSNMGSEYQQMKKPVEALKYFCKYIEADPSGSNVTYATAQARTLYIEMGGVPSVEDDQLCKPIVKQQPDPPPNNNVVTPPPGGGSPGSGEIGGGGSGQVDTGPKTKTSPLRWAGIGVAVVGAGVFGLGVYYGLEAKNISDEITNHNPNNPWPSDIKDKEAEGESAEQKQVGFMIGGGIAIAAGIAMIVLAPSGKTSTETISIAPVATGDSFGFAAAGRF